MRKGKGTSFNLFDRFKTCCRAWLGLPCIGLDYLGKPRNTRSTRSTRNGKETKLLVLPRFRGRFHFRRRGQDGELEPRTTPTTRKSGRRFQQTRFFFGFIGFDWPGLGRISLDWVRFSREVSGLIGLHSVVTRKLVRGIGAKGIITVWRFAA